MARKPVLEGGKRDEILNAATQLFFENGFENTSVRMVLEKVGGEVGMFYHYFKSKNELFDMVVDRFFCEYSRRFSEMIRECDSIDCFVERFLPMLEQSMDKYRLLEGNMHWTIKCAMHERTLISLIPVIEECLDRLGYTGKYPKSITAGRLVADISIVIHTEDFANMKREKQGELLTKLLNEII